jgi:hypothetical protein
MDEPVAHRPVRRFAGPGQFYTATHERSDIPTASPAGVDTMTAELRQRIADATPVSDRSALWWLSLKGIAFAAMLAPLWGAPVLISA